MHNLVWFIIVGIIAGWLAGRFLTGSDGNLVSNLIVGVIGAIVGGFLFRMIGLKATGFLGDIVVSTAGAVVLLTALRYANRR
jgi:uncharacterized membrane protein YeaQ/YmgE (transglycosylase-associated protein family)